MASIKYSLILFVLITEICCLTALSCYSCMTTKSNTTDCYDKFNSNGTSISIVNVSTSDSLCVKIRGKLSNGNKFIYRYGSVMGCPKGSKSAIILENSSVIQISALQVDCCNKNLCNHAIQQFSFPLSWIYIMMSALLFGLFKF